MKGTILKDLAQFQAKDSNALTASDIKKIESYYGNAVASILGEGFCVLSGKSMTKEERTALTYLGALTGIFDDFFDKLNTPHNHIKNLIDHPDNTKAHNAHEELFLTFWNKAKENLPSIELSTTVFHRVFDAQVLSQRQTNENLSKEEVKTITFEKGAASIQFYRTVFGQINNEQEYKLIEKIGQIGQLENDIFDVYKDNENQINTLVTSCNRINEIRELYLNIFNQIRTLVYQTTYEETNIENFLRFISTIISRGFVCLDFLEKSEDVISGFISKNYLRKALVCDMENPINILKNLHYYAKLA